MQALPDAAHCLASTVRWFEDHYTVTPEWPDECYINHSFAPCGLWHLGFVFALDDLPAGTEITVDYRHLLAPGQEEDFRDSISGEADRRLRLAREPWRVRRRSCSSCFRSPQRRAMSQFLLKVLISALVVAGASELARRYSVIGACSPRCR